MKKQTNRIKAKMLIVLLFSTLLCAGSVQFTISPLFKAANFWMPGNGNGLNLTQNFNGQLQLYVNQMKNLGVTHFRIGGKAYDQGNMWDPDDLEKIILWLRSHGFEVIVQAPIDPNLTIAQNAARTASYVTWMNVDRNLKVELWAIGNEPDGAYASPYNTSSVVASYIKACAVAMRTVTGQEHIKLIGPSYTWYNDNVYENEFLNSSSANFIGGTTVINNQTVPYLDYISFNQYPYNFKKYDGDATVTPSVPPVPRQDVIEYLTSPGRMKQDIQDLKDKISTIARSSIPLGIIITEANISTEQHTVSATTKGLSGLGPGSFIGGQFWAETMAIGMEKGIASLMHWSVVEGTGSDHHLTDIGLIGKETTTNTANPYLRPAYHHFKVMNKQFKGTFHPTVSVTHGNNKVKAWAAQSGDRIAVMVQNQNTGSSTPFHVRLDNNTSAKGSGTVDVLFNIPNLNASAQYTSLANLDPESTVLLIFNCKGAFAWRYDYSLADAIASPSASFALTESKSPSPMIKGSLSFTANPQVVGFGETTTINMSPTSYTYSWSGPCGNVPVTSAGTQASLTACKQGTSSVYTYIAKDGNGCLYSEEVAINDIGVIVGGPYIHLASVGASTCGASNGWAYMDCGNNCAGATYSWDDATPVSTKSISGLAPGMHTVKMLYGSSTVSFSFLIPITGTQPAIFAGFDHLAAKLCLVHLEAQPALTGQTYEWFTDNSTVPFTTARQISVSHWLGTNYRVKVTTAAGCTNEDEVIVGRKDLVACMPVNFGMMLPCDKLFNETHRSGSSITSETLTESYTIEKNTYLDKILTVPEGVTLTIQNCIVAFSPSAHIVLQGGGTVILETTYFVPCGVTYYPFLSKGSGNNSTLIVRNSSFEGATIAFDLYGAGEFEFQNNVFSRNGTGIRLEDCEGFSITQNSFYDVERSIKCVSNASVTSGQIESNHFIEAETAIELQEGDHSLLSVTCNTLEYSEYGILSEGTISDFGSSQTSAGNYFLSSSPNNNHQFHHTGNAVTYYCGPQNSFTLNSSNGCMATVAASTEEMVCPDYTNIRKQTPEKLTPVTAMQLFAFPNPTQEKISIACSVPEASGKTFFTLYDLASGKKVLEREVAHEKSQFEIDLSPYANGLYAGVLRAASGEAQHVKIVKAE